MDNMTGMTAKTLQRPATEKPIAHRVMAAPNEHLCACGKLREHCVRETVRAMWR